MTSQQIGYFIKLAEDLNYTNVANYFYITQPTLSRQIINLETELGFALFIREKNKVMLTPEGRDFYQGITQIHDHLYSLVSDIHQKYQKSDKQLSIAIMDEQLMSPALLLAINSIRHQDPHLNIRFNRDGHFSIWNGLLDGRYDLINSIRMPQDTLGDNIEFLLLEREKTYIAIEQSLEEDLPDLLSPEETEYLLRKYPLYLPEIEKPSHFNPIEDLLSSLHVNMQKEELQVLYAGDLLSVPMHVIAKMGIAITNQSNLYYVDPHIRILEVAGASTYEKGIFYHSQSDNPALHILLDDFAQNYALSKKN